MRAALFLLACCLVLMSCDNNVKPPDTGNGGGDEPPRVIYLGNPPVIINEVYSANANLKDEFGNNSGWVEFYNPADTAVNLNGYWLTNSLNRRQWTFGDVEIEAGGYLLAFMSGRNLPDLGTVRDTIDLIQRTMVSWDWADSRVDPPDIPGGSTAKDMRTPDRIAGTLTTVNNSGGLGWTSAEVCVKFASWKSAAVLDLSNAERIIFRGYVTKDARFEVRLIQKGTEGWQGWPAYITGTGNEDETYVVEFPSGNSEYPDLKNIEGLRFSNAGGFFGTTDFSFSSVSAPVKGSSVHASFRLSNSGGTIFLLDPEWHIRDSVAYPSATLNLSYAKNIDNGKWAHSKPPTPGGPNVGESFAGQVQPPASASIPNSGHYEEPLNFTLPLVDGGLFIACDTTGRFPAAGSPLRSGAEITLTGPTVMRCAQFIDGAHPSTPVMRTYIIGRLPDLPIVSIAIDPHDMFDPTDGLYMMGPNATTAEPYYGANFWQETELPVQIEFFERGAQHKWTSPAGLRIFGSWSRGKAKKSVVISFRAMYGQSRLRYSLFPDYPQLNTFKHFVLRNNGNNFPHDYIRDMLMTSLTEGLGIDYQKGRAVVVYYNGQYFGIHNLRERANSDYFETNYGIDEDFIDLVGAANDVRRGSDADYQDIFNWVSGIETLSDDDLKILEQRIDVDDFTYNHICRTYYNDRDWPGNNMKRWRVNSPPSRWRWLMYDTDHGWGGPGIYHRPEIGMLAFATQANGPSWPNPPHSTLMLRKLLENEGYKNSFINRFSLMIATYFAPARVGARIDALMAPVESEIPFDQARWIQSTPERTASAMNNQLGVIRNFGRTRPAEMQREIETFFGLGEAANLTVEAEGGGNVQVDNLQVLNRRATFKAYPEVPVALKAVPNPGVVFTGWSDGNTNAERVVTVNGATTLKASFGAPSF